MLASISRSARPVRAGWKKLSPPGSSKTANHYRHVSGWELRHCGHPTANYPWYAVDPSHPETVTVTHNGKGFRLLIEAQIAVEGVVAGRLRTTDENCVPPTRIVVEAR